jgi:hypothetical protein
MPKPSARPTRRGIIRGVLTAATAVAVPDAGLQAASNPMSADDPTGSASATRPVATLLHWRVSPGGEANLQLHLGALHRAASRHGATRCDQFQPDGDITSDTLLVVGFRSLGAYEGFRADLALLQRQAGAPACAAPATMTFVTPLESGGAAAGRNIPPRAISARV